MFRYDMDESDSDEDLSDFSGDELNSSSRQKKQSTKSRWSKHEVMIY